MLSHHKKTDNKLRVIFTGFILCFVLHLGVYGYPAVPIDESLEDTATIEEVNQQVENIRSIRSLLIQKNGQLLSEKYMNRLSPGENINMKSASKSIISLLVGIAIREGFIRNKNQQIHEFFPEYFSQVTDSLKRSITIEDLLTMRAGLETTSSGNYGRWVSSSNWVEYVLDQPMEDIPGGDMIYSTGSSHLLSVIIEKASGMSTRSFAQQYLFNPMNIELGGWDRDPQGYYFGGNNMGLSPRDMLKVGQMVLDGGSYNGQQIIPTEWLEASFQSYTMSEYNPYYYGYMWWNNMVGDYKVYFAWGHGGQYIFMLPALNSVVVITSWPLSGGENRTYKEPIFNLLQTYIIPALEAANTTGT